MTSFASGTAETLPSIYNLQSGVYHALHPREIRLVKLLRGRGPSKICCQLYHASLSNGPAYKALSYAWGSLRATRPILVNGYQHSVTVNLESALRRLRRIDSDVTLWIDALSINQSDNSERTEQVNLMHDIFASTEEVIVYLGELPPHGFTTSNKPVSTSTATFHCDDRDTENLEIFRRRCIAKTPPEVPRSKAKMDFAFDIFCFLRLLAGEADMNDLPAFDPNSGQFIDTEYQKDIFEGLRQLILRRWWNRIWVIQEIVVPKIVTIVYGSAVAPWDMFVDSARWDLRHRSSSASPSFPHEYSAVLTYFSRIILDIERMRELWRDGKRTALLALLRRFSGRKASDDRDKVYALLSLVRSQTSILPDYSLGVATVFETTALDIVKTTKSLTVLAGDLGRKDRQDLPSWVPDWSAAYDDLDRRRADNTENCNATDGSHIFVQDEGAEEWSGICQYLGIDRCGIQTLDALNDIVGTSDWIDWLPDELESEPGTERYLAAIENFYFARGIAARLQNIGGGIIQLGGLHVDRIAVTGETAFSDDVLLSVVRSWAVLVQDYFRNKNYDRSSGGLGDAFRRTLCADTIHIASTSTTRRINKDDHGLIATWCLQGTDSEPISSTTIPHFLFENLGDHVSFLTPKISPSIEAAIRSATVRRTFFITDKGYIGLGPAQLRAGDHLYILLGGQTPFVLRDAGSRKIFRMPDHHSLGHETRKCFEVVGDSYTHGLMDGEAMREWRSKTGNMKLHTLPCRLLKQWRATFQSWATLSTDLSKWRLEIDRERLLARMRFYSKSYDENDLIGLEKSLEGPNELSSNTKAEVLANSYTSDLSQWRHRFYSGEEKDLTLELIKVAILKVKQIEKDMANAEDKMHKIKELICSIDSVAGNQGQVYLV